MDTQLIKTALACRCPRCRKGKIFKGGGLALFNSLALFDSCPECGLELANKDEGDGPAVFLIFILGFSLVPLALFVDHLFAPPLWVHAVLWSVIGLGLTVGMLRPAKALVLAMQYKHKPETWDEPDNGPDTGDTP